MQKWSRRGLLVSAVALLGAGCTHAIAGQAPYSIGVRGEGNKVTIASASGAATSYIVNVASARGTGQATVAWWGQYAPLQLSFQLELNGLEHFQLHWDDTLINVNVNAFTQHITQSVQRGEAAENTLVATSPLWMETRLPTVETSGFTVATPPAFTQDGPRLWAIAWVDFYR